MKTKSKKTAKKVAKVATRAPRFVGTAKITVLTKENPRREGSVQAKRYATILKFAGKTVEAYQEAKGDTLALRYAVEQGHAKVA